MSFLKIFDKNNRNIEISPEDIFLDSHNLSGLDTGHSQGSFAKPLIGSSYIIGVLGLCFVFGVFVYKSYTIQVRDYAIWYDRSVNNFIDKTPVFAYRGMIRDKNGVVLAWNDSQDNAATSTSQIPKRHYIQEEGFSNLLGYVNYPKKDKAGIFWREDYLGIEGVEKFYNDHLSGEKGERIVEVNVKGEVLRDNIINNPKEGKILDLYLDNEVQKIFYNRLKQVVDAQKFSGGAGVLMDIRTGGVIAAASYPDFDNNIFVNASTTEDKAKKQMFLESKSTPMLSRAISGLYTPGSVVKPFMVYAALNEGVIDEYKNILSTGQLVIKNRYGGPDTIFRDWKEHGYVDAREAVAVSSDEYFYQIGGGYKDQEGLGIARIDKYMSMFGFASTTGVDFVPEKSGIIPTPEWKKKNFEDGDWLLGNTYHSSIGQYGFKTSPLSLARSVAMIATDGKVISPKIANLGPTSTLTSDDKDQRLELNEKFNNVAKEGMAMSASPVGTAHYFNDLPFKVGAKTGTAQLGVKNERVNSWSTGFYPYENPRYVFVFMMESGPSTNTVGASKIMRQVFQDMIDRDMEYVKF